MFDDELMWEEDRIWLPYLLQGKMFNLVFFFSEEGKLLNFKEAKLQIEQGEQPQQ